MIVLEKNVPPVYVDESRDFQYFLRGYDAVFNMVKNDTDTLRYLTSSKECQSRVLPLLKTKLGFFTNYSLSDEMLRGILSGFPTMVKNKGSLEAIQEALNIFLKVLNIRTEIILKVTGNESEMVEGSIEVGDHTILIAIDSAIKDFYILEELFKYIMPAGYMYTFFFYKEIAETTWMLNKHTGRFLIVNTLESDSIRTHTLYNDAYDYVYEDPFINKMINQVNTINLYEGYTDDELIVTNDHFVMIPLTFEPECFETDYYFFFKKLNGKYYQLTQKEDYQAGKYYIPQFIFINDEEDNWQVHINPEYNPEDPESERFVYEPVYVLMNSDDEDLRVLPIGAHYIPNPDYDPQDPESEEYLQFEYCRFKDEYYNYYILEDGRYKNLTKPEEFRDNTFYKIKTKRCRIMADDVVVHSVMPITSVYISTIIDTIMQSPNP